MVFRRNTRVARPLGLAGVCVVSLLLLSAGDALGQKKKGGAPGEVNTPPAFGERKKDTLKVGDLAPDFSLPLVKGKGEVKLSSLRGKKPVVLIFGSYT